MSPTAPFLALERDEKFKRGRAKAGGGTVYYSIPGAAINGHDVLTLAANTDYYGPAMVETPIVVDQLAFEVTTLAAGANARVGLYRATPDWQPTGAPLADSGNISVATTGVKTYTPGTPLFLSRGKYVSIINSDGTPILRAVRMNHANAIATAIGATPFENAWRVGRSYAAFPTPGTAWTTTTGESTVFEAVVLFRVLTP